MKKLVRKWKQLPLPVKVSLAYVVCSIIQKGLAFFTLPLFSRMLTKEQYGQYTTFASWSSIIAIFITLNLQYGSFPTAMTKYEKDRDRYISSIEGICLLLTGTFLVIYLPFRGLVNKILKLPTPFVILMVLSILGETSLGFWYGKKRFEYKYKSVIAITLLYSLLSPALAFIAIRHYEEKGYARIAGYCIVTIFIGGIILLLNLAKGKKLYVSEYWKYALKFNIPLIVYYLSQTVFNQSDRLMIDHYCGEADVAVYGVAYNIAMVLMFVLTAINNAYVPWLYSMYKENKQSRNKRIGIYISLLMGVMILGIIWIAPEFIYIMAGKKYFEARWVVPPVAVSLFTYVFVAFSTNVEFYFEEKKALVKASIGSAVLNVVLNALFIPIYGYIAAAYTTLLSYVLFALYNYIEMRKVVRKNHSTDGYDWGALLRIYFAFLALAIIGMVLYDFRFIRIALMISVMLAGICFRKRVKLIIQNVKEEFHER